MARNRPSAAVLDAWQALLVGHKALVARLDREMRDAHALPLERYDVLYQLSVGGGTRTMGDLAEALLVAPSKCTRLVTRMADAGLVDRRRDGVDSRVVHASLTPAGTAMLRRAATTHLRGLQRHLGRFLDDETARSMASSLAAAVDSSAA